MLDKISVIYGGSLPASNLTLVSTTAAGTSDYIAFQTGSQTERLRISTAGVITVTGSLSTSSDFAVNTNKFTVAAATGNTAVAGTLGVTGDFAVNTNKFTVTASSGNTAVAGTLNVTGAATLASVTGAAIATQSDQETSTSTTTIVSPGRQQFHPSAAKAWVKWGVTTSIDASYNVSSITDNATGDWTVNIGTDFSSANYAAVSNIEFGGTAFSSHIQASGQAAGTLRIEAYNTNSGALADPTKNHVICFGDQ
jgi:hypothetical protein